MRKRWLAVLGCWAGAAICGAQQIRLVTVVGAWGGLGTPAKSQLTLRPSADGFAGGGVKLKADSLNQLLRAMQEPILTKPSASNLGIDEAWLHARMEVAGRNASMLYFDQGTAAQKQFFARKFMDMSTLQTRLDSVYQGFHTDDYPSMKVTIELEDGTLITATTKSQNPLMLPWCMGTTSKGTNTFNAHISQALFAILPKKFADRDRLRDDDSFGDLAPQMGLYMSGNLEREWNMIGVRDKDSASLKKLEQHFTVRYADINTWNDLAFNEVPNTGKTVDENLQVSLWRSGFPAHFEIAAHLLRKDGVTEGVDELPERATRYANEVLAIGWLREFFRTHPEEHAFVVYVHGLSMTDKALRIFSTDMGVAGRPNVVQRVRDAQNEAALLETGSGDWWIVLPDHSMILWRWGSLRPILKWPANTFDATRCTDYQDISGGCAGAVISPEGQIVQ